MRSRTAQVERIDTRLMLRIPSFRDPAAEERRRVGRDGKVYPVGERWDWRRIALRREAVWAVLEIDPGASVRVVRDVLAKYGHRVSHEQVRGDIVQVTARPPGLVESRRWLPLDAWREETARRRQERTAPASRRSSPPSTVERSVTLPEARVRSVPTRMGQPSQRRDDWAVWDEPRRHSSSG